MNEQNERSDDYGWADVSDYLRGRDLSNQPARVDCTVRAFEKEATFRAQTAEQIEKALAFQNLLTAWQFGQISYEDVMARLEQRRGVGVLK